MRSIADCVSRFVSYHNRPNGSASEIRSTPRLSLNYAQSRACFRSGEIRVLDCDGAVERIIGLMRLIEDCDSKLVLYCAGQQLEGGAAHTAHSDEDKMRAASRFDAQLRREEALQSSAGINTQ